MIRPQLPVFVLLLVGLILVHFYLFYRTVPTQVDCTKCDASHPTAPKRRGRFQRESSGDKVKAAFVILARNSDIEGLNKTIPMLEERFNSKFNYPYVFLNDVPFNERFKTAVRQLSPSKMSFGTIPTEHWSYPSWINVTRADEARADMERRDIIYGGSLSYRHMCRYNSGFFFRHPILQEYDYYWRVEPWVEFFCDVDYDPFLFMKKNNKDYGFTIMVPEYRETIPTLWGTVEKFMDENSQIVHPKNCLKMFRSDDGSYNMCHFWSNFEIASLKFFRSGAYLKYFEYLDKSGGFFYERWGDAPVHSIAVAMFLPKEKVHYFEDIGYFHNPFLNCPANPALQLRCSCNPKKSESLNNNCFDRYKDLYRS
jgi:alpha 1,2-mannosyltransferase